MTKAIQYGVGIGLIIAGIIGLFVPLLQGVLMIIAGVVILKADKIDKKSIGEVLGRFRNKIKSKKIFN
jgi:uncharacterized protein YqgC (DUF456 family)